MDKANYWQLLRLVTLCDAVLDEATPVAPEGDDGVACEVHLPYGTLAFSFFDKGFDTLKDCAALAGWIMNCRTAGPEKPGVCVELIRVVGGGGVPDLASSLPVTSQAGESTTNVSYEPVPRDVIAGVRSAALRLLPLRVAAESEEELAAPFRYAFGAMQSALIARGSRGAPSAPKLPMDPRLPVIPPPAPHSLEVLLIPYADRARAAPQYRPVLGGHQLKLSLRLLEADLSAAHDGSGGGPKEEDGRAFTKVLAEGVLMAAAAAFVVTVECATSSALQRRHALLAALISELRRMNQIGGARFPVSLLEQSALLASPDDPSVHHFKDLRRRVEFPELAALAADAAVEGDDEEPLDFPPPATYAAELDALAKELHGTADPAGASPGGGASPEAACT